MLSIMRSKLHDLSIEALSGNRILTMRCPDPVNSTRLCFDYVELGYPWPNTWLKNAADLERIVSMELQSAHMAPALGISLALRRCAFPVTDRYPPQGAKTQLQPSFSRSTLWVGGVWCDWHQRPVSAIMREGIKACSDSEARSIPLVLNNEDLMWWLDAQLVDRKRLLELSRVRRRHWNGQNVDARLG